MNLRHDSCALSYRRFHSLRRAGSDIADREYPRQTRPEGGTTQRVRVRRILQPGKNVALLIESNTSVEPSGVGLSAYEHEDVSARNNSVAPKPRFRRVTPCRNPGRSP